MQFALTHSIQSSRLILIFAGWGMDARPLSGLRHHAYDIAVAYDHRSLRLPADFNLNAYSEICIIAWSFGVPAANAFLRDNPSLPVTARIAVNGTLHPVDDRLGIPEAIFNGTLHSLSPATLTKFRRRMCGSSENFIKFSTAAPVRTDIEELAGELQAIRCLPAAADSDLMRWDMVYISASDRIIPAENQQRAWARHPHVITLQGPHLPDFDLLLQKSIVDKRLIAKRFADSSASYDSAAQVQRDIACQLGKMISEAATESTRDILEIGCGTGMLTNSIARHFPSAELTLWDLTPISGNLPGRHRRCDAETEILTVAPGSLDLIASASTIQWFNSPIEFIRNCHKALRADGLLAISTFGPDNFSELRPYLNAPLPYTGLTAWREVMQSCGFEIINLADQHHTLSFPDTASLIRHIRLTGVNALPAGPASPATTRALLSGGPTTLTYHPIFILSRPTSPIG